MNGERHPGRRGKTLVWLDIALVAFLALVVIAAVSFRRETGSGHGYAWMLFPVGLLCWISGRRFNAGLLITGALTWGAIFLFLVFLYAYRFDLLMLAMRLLAAIH